MFEYIVWMEFTAEAKNEEESLEALQVAQYKFDLGLEVNEMIKLEDICILGEAETSYVGTVKKKEKVIKQHKNGDIFSINVFIEVADKENFEKMRDLLKQHRPDKF